MWAHLVYQPGGFIDRGRPNLGSKAVGKAYRDSWRAVVKAPPGSIWAVVSQMGDEHGSFSSLIDAGWSLRGAVDEWLGGQGIRKHQARALVDGERIDFWRIEESIPGHYLRLRALLKTPGTTWLEISVDPHQEGSTLTYASSFAPDGARGKLYWWSSRAIHFAVFGAMFRALRLECQPARP